MVETTIVSPASSKKSSSFDSLINTSKSDLYFIFGLVISKLRIKLLHISRLLLRWYKLRNSLFALSHVSSLITKTSSLKFSKWIKCLISARWNKSKPSFDCINLAFILFLNNNPVICRASSFVLVSTQVVPVRFVSKISFTRGEKRFLLRYCTIFIIPLSFCFAITGVNFNLSWIRFANWFENSTRLLLLR